MTFSVLTAFPSQLRLASTSDSRNLRSLVTFSIHVWWQLARQLEPEEMLNRNSSPHSQKPWSCQSMDDEGWTRLWKREKIVFTFLKLVSLQLDFRTSAPCLLPLVITCSGPPLPAAGDDLGTKVEIKCGSEVSPCQKQPSRCQLPYPPLSYLSRLWNSQHKQGK